MSVSTIQARQAFDFASHPLFSSNSTNRTGFEAIPVAPAASSATAAAARETDSKNAAPCDYFFQKALHVESDRLESQPGYLRLVPGRAVTLQASQPGVLRIAQGRVWVTFSNAAQDGRVRAGDYFVDRGQSLPLLAGHKVVLEAFDANNQASAFFTWEPVAPPRVARAAALARWALS
jgi:Protein of unknown function (DUF2917)